MIGIDIRRSYFPIALSQSQSFFFTLPLAFDLKFNQNFDSNKFPVEQSPWTPSFIIETVFPPLFRGPTLFSYLCKGKLDRVVIDIDLSSFGLSIVAPSPLSLSLSRRFQRQPPIYRNYCVYLSYSLNSSSHEEPASIRFSGRKRNLSPCSSTDTASFITLPRGGSSLSNSICPVSRIFSKGRSLVFIDDNDENGTSINSIACT